MQEQIDQIVSRLDENDTLVQENADNLDQNLTDVQTTLDDLSANEGQLMFPLSQDTIDLIKEQIPVATVSTFGGVLNAAAAGSLPTGWTASVTGTTYTVTHNLGTTVYSVVANAIGANLPIVYLTPGTNSFTIEFASGGGYFATPFNFILTLIV